MGIEKEIDHPNTVKKISSLQDRMEALQCIYAGQFTRNVGLEKIFGKVNFLISKNGVLLIRSVFR